MCLGWWKWPWEKYNRGSPPTILRPNRRKGNSLELASISCRPRLTSDFPCRWWWTVLTYVLWILTGFVAILVWLGKSQSCSTELSQRISSLATLTPHFLRCARCKDNHIAQHLSFLNIIECSFLLQIVDAARAANAIGFVDGLPDQFETQVSVFFST